jgi:hypothetical protein
LGTTPSESSRTIGAVPGLALTTLAGGLEDPHEIKRQAPKKTSKAWQERKKRQVIMNLG